MNLKGKFSAEFHWRPRLFVLLPRVVTVARKRGCVLAKEFSLAAP